MEQLRKSYQNGENPGAQLKRSPDTWFCTISPRRRERIVFGGSETQDHGDSIGESYVGNPRRRGFIAVEHALTSSNTLCDSSSRHRRKPITLTVLGVTALITLIGVGIGAGATTSVFLLKGNEELANLKRALEKSDKDHKTWHKTAHDQCDWCE